MQQPDQTKLPSSADAKAFWIVDAQYQRVFEPVELIASELSAVAGGPEVENGSSNLTADQHWF